MAARQVSGKRRRNSQPLDDIRVRIPRWGDKKSFIGGRVVTKEDCNTGLAAKPKRGAPGAGRCSGKWLVLNDLIVPAANAIPALFFLEPRSHSPSQAVGR